MSYLPHDDLVLDSSQDLAAALSAIPSGTRVYLNAGTYVITAPITLTGKSNILIDGGPGTVIQYTPAGGRAFYINGCTGITLRGFRLEVPALNTNAAIDMIGANKRITLIDLDIAGGAACAAIHQNGGSITDYRVVACNIQGAFNGAVRFVAGAVVNGVRIVDCTLIPGASGISVIDFTGSFPNQNDLVVASCYVSGGDNAIYAPGVDRLAVDGCIFQSNSRHGMNILGSAEDISVTGCIVDSPGQRGINFDSAAVSVATIDGNIVKSTGTRGISVNGSAISVCANVVDTAAQQGIYHEGTAADVIIRSNVVFAAANDGIWTSGGTTRVVIVGNCIRSAVFKSIYINGTAIDIIAAHNVCHGSTSDDIIKVAGTSSVAIQVSGNVISNSSARGIYINGPTKSLVAGNVIFTTAGHGINLDNSGTNNQVFSNILDTVGTGGNNGIYFAGVGVAQCRGNIVHNVGSGTGQTGILCDGNALDILIEACHVYTTRGRAISIATGAATGFVAVRGCLALGPSGATQSMMNLGNATDPDCTFEGCMSINSSNFGFTTAAARCLTVDCHAVGATASGIRFTTTNPILHAIVHCMSIGNTAAGISADGNHSAWLIKGNYCAGNGGQGILINTADEGDVVGNLSDNNTSYGVQENAGSDQNLYTENHLRNNVAGATLFNGTNRTAVDNKV